MAEALTPDDDLPLVSYTPLGPPVDSGVQCEDDDQLERRYLTMEGLYYNTEVGEGPVVV